MFPHSNGQVGEEAGMGVKEIDLLWVYEWKLAVKEIYCGCMNENWQ